MGQVIFAHIKLLGQTLQGQRLAVMDADVGQDFGDQGGFLFSFPPLGSAPQGDPIQFHHKLQEHGFGIEVAAVGPGIAFPDHGLKTGG